MHMHQFPVGLNRANRSNRKTLAKRARSSRFYNYLLRTIELISDDRNEDKTKR
jgi:hypothetical protein